MKIGVGAAPVVDYLKRGIPVAIGTDGAASNNDLSIFGAMDLGTKLQKLMHGDSTAMVAAVMVDPVMVTTLPARTTQVGGVVEKAALLTL